MSKILSLKIPQNWTILKLEDIGKWGSGGTPKKGIAEYYSGDIPWLKIGDLNDGLVEEAEERITELGLRASSAKLLPLGVLLIAMYGSIGKLGITGIHCATNQAIAFCYPDVDLINLKYLFWLLRNSKSELTAAGKGGTQQNISQTVLKAFEIPLPPLNEQRRIVAKIEALKARSQKAKEALEEIPPLLDQFRQSVLAAAFRGDLTADWRSQNPDVEPASILISSLNTPYPELCLDVFEKSSNYELPPSWIWVPLGKLGLLMGGGTPSKDNPNFWNGSIPWVSPKDMKQDRIIDSIDHISEEAISNSSVKQIPKGAILFVVRGMILNHTFPVAITESVVTVNQDMKAFVPEFTEMNEYLLLVSKFIENKILFWVKAATHGTRRLETPILRNWAFPIPPSKEQLEIVRRVQKLLKTADLIEQSYKEAKAYLDQLDQSILAKAFRGEPVPQDPNDEPASILLERIQAERAKREAETKTAKKSTGKTTGQRSRKAKQQDLESIQLGLPGLE